jgi:hypothetical protein
MSCHYVICCEYGKRSSWCEILRDPVLYIILLCQADLICISTFMISRHMCTGSERYVCEWAGNLCPSHEWQKPLCVVRGKEIMWQMFWNRFKAVIIRSHDLNIAFTYVNYKHMVGTLHIFSHLKHLRHSYSIFRRSDGRVLALVIFVYVSRKKEFGMTRPWFNDVSWWKYEGFSSETRSGIIWAKE